MTDRRGATVTLVTVVALAVLLAGCIGGGGTSDADDPDAPDSELPEAGTNATGEQRGDERPHVHDRWEGEERKGVVEGATVTLSIVDPDEPDGTDSCIRADGVCFGGEEVAPDGIVPPGTGWVNVTASFPEDQFHKVEVLYQDAFSSSWSTAGQVASGGTKSIQIQDVRQTDDGHAEVSRWKFAVQARDNPHQPGLYHGPGTPQGGDVTVDIQAIRAPGELPKEPAHPEYFVNTSLHRVSYIEASVDQMVQAGTVTVEQGTDDTVPVGPFDDGILWRSSPGVTGRRADDPAADRMLLEHPHDVSLVPPSSDQLIAVVQVTGDSSTTAGAEICLYGSYKPSHLLGDELDCLSYDGGEDTQTITRGLKPTETDTPYTDNTGRNASRWTFWLRVAAPGTGGQRTVGDFSGSLQVAVFVTEGVDFEQPTWAFEI